MISLISGIYKTKQKQTHRCREQTDDYLMGKGGVLVMGGN